MKPTVYLAGPISGQTYAEMKTWREYVEMKLDARSIYAVSPTRGAEYDPPTGEASTPYTTPTEQHRLIMRRDHYDCTHAACVLVNLLGARKVSIGTVMEMAWAYDRQIPVVLAIEPTGNIHEHGMLMETPMRRAASLDEAIDAVCVMLQPYIGGGNQ